MNVLYSKLPRRFRIIVNKTQEIKLGLSVTGSKTLLRMVYQACKTYKTDEHNNSDCYDKFWMNV